ncbi:phage tail fiber protein [Citrobacter sedlakii]
MRGDQGWKQTSAALVGVLSSRNWNDNSGGDSVFQIGINRNGAGYKVAQPSGDTYYLSDVIKFRDERNTTVDSNGFIKVASPIVKIFRDGSYETNEESEGVAVTHINTGEYLIAGCTGLNADAAWGGIDGGFEIPVDRNKLARIWLDYEVNADGSVLVKTYHRTHPEAPEFARNEINGLTNGEPVDIPADSFVSVRVEMPPDSIWNQRQNDALEADVQKPTS